MTLEQIRDEIRSLRPSQRIELYRWLDYEVVADYGVGTNFCSRIGVDRSLEFRHAIDQDMKITVREAILTKRSHPAGRFLLTEGKGQAAPAFRPGHRFVIAESIVKHDRFSFGVMRFSNPLFAVLPLFLSMAKSHKRMQKSRSNGRFSTRSMVSRKFRPPV
jgi:hypothetical protein